MSHRLSRNPVVAVVGATGAVGAEMLHCLNRRRFPAAQVRVFASEKSAGKVVPFGGGTLTVEALSEQAFDGVDVALFASSSGISRQYVPVARAAGALVIDNSSAFRMDADIPLVVPEVNGDLLAGDAGVIANPNCVAALMVVALAPLEKLSPIQRIVASTYQAASGAGAAAMQELEDATRAYLDGNSYAPKVLPHPYAFNLFSHNADVNEDSGYNGEEEKASAEVRKIMGRPDLPIGMTCIRVPILRAHAVSASVTFADAVGVEEAREALRHAAGVRLVDDRGRNYFPMPHDASHEDDVLVGRLRVDQSDPSGRTLALFLSGDQLLKGAALNAVQIAEAMLPVEEPVAA